MTYPNPDWPCSWWLTPKCRLNSSHLMLISCQQGHIRERLLCTQHQAAAVDCINGTMLYCDTCNDPLTHHMSKTPLEDHWDLETAKQDIEALITTFGTTPPPRIGPTVPPSIGGAAWGLPLPKKTPTQKELDELRKALNDLKKLEQQNKERENNIKEAYKALSTPTKDPKTLRWINQHFGKKKNP